MYRAVRSLRRPIAAVAIAATPLLAQCDGPVFEKVKCKTNEQHTHDVRKITFEAPSHWSADNAPIVNILVKKAANPKPIVRPYNPIQIADGEVTLLVKRYSETAQMGSTLHTLAPGDEIDMKGPNQQVKGKFEPGNTHYGFVAGGTGITPIMQATNYILKNDTAKVTLITCNKTVGDILLREELDALQAAYPGRLNITHVVEEGNFLDECIPGSRIVSAHKGGNVTKMALGRPSANVLSALPAPGEGVMVMVCGRPPMTAAVAGKKVMGPDQGDVGGLLKELGYEKNQVWRI